MDIQFFLQIIFYIVVMFHVSFRPKYRKTWFNYMVIGWFVNDVAHVVVSTCSVSQWTGYLIGFACFFVVGIIYIITYGKNSDS